MKYKTRKEVLADRNLGDTEKIDELEILAKSERKNKRAYRVSFVSPTANELDRDTLRKYQ